MDEEQLKLENKVKKYKMLRNIFWPIFVVFAVTVIVFDAILIYSTFDMWVDFASGSYRLDFAEFFNDLTSSDIGLTSLIMIAVFSVLEIVTLALAITFTVLKAMNGNKIYSKKITHTLYGTGTWQSKEPKERE